MRHGILSASQDMRGRVLSVSTGRGQISIPILSPGLQKGTALLHDTIPADWLSTTASSSVQKSERWTTVTFVQIRITQSKGNALASTSECHTGDWDDFPREMLAQNIHRILTPLLYYSLRIMLCLSWWGASMSVVFMFMFSNDHHSLGCF